MIFVVIIPSVLFMDSNKMMDICVLGKMSPQKGPIYHQFNSYIVKIGYMGPDNVLHSKEHQ